MKKNFIKVLLYIIICIIFGFFLNFYIDSYGIFGNNLKYQTLEPNQNYIKTKYILENKTKFNAFIFGSSRIGNIPTEEIKEYNIYNMTYSEGLPSEWKENLETFIENGIRPKLIILGIDDFDFKVDSNEHKSQLMRKSYKSVNRFMDYIFINPLTMYNKTKIYNILYSNENVDFEKNLKMHGRLLKQKALCKEQEIRNHSQQHLAKQVFKQNSGYSYLKNTQIEEAINSINKIQKICKKYNIKLIIFFNPIHPKSYKDKIAWNEYRNIRSIIKKKFYNIEIYDFTEDECIYNNMYWFETTHFNSTVGRKILYKIFKKN